MTFRASNNNKYPIYFGNLDEILYPRVVSPFLWDIIIGCGGCGEGLVLFFYSNKVFILSYSLSYFFFCLFHMLLNRFFDENSKTLEYSIKYNNKEMNIYNGENTFVKYALFTIYLLGITKKDFTIVDKTTLKRGFIDFV